MKFILIILVQFLLFLSINFAQVENKSITNTNQSPTSKVQENINDYLKKVLNISGQAGLYGELYSISGKEGRRKPSAGRLFFRPTITIFNNFNIAFDIMLSTEGSYTRQQINRISLHPSWDWGKAHIGDFTHQFSEYSLNGVTITGGGLEIHYGFLRFEAVGGRTQRKINAGLSNSAYARYLGGIKLGIGETGNSFVDLNIVRVKDDIYSLPANKFAYTENSGEMNKYRVTPKENLIAGLNGSLDINNVVQLFGEITGSVFTRDIGSDILESEEIPNFVNSIFTLRHSTFADYAYNAGFNFKYDKYNAKLEYSVINPGYTSLGLTTNLNDRRTFRFSAGARLLNNKLNLRGNFQLNKNNLLSQKQYTLTRSNLGFSVRFVPVNDISINLKTSFNNMKNDAYQSERLINNVVSLYTINTMWRLKLFNLNHTVTGSYSFQQSKDYNILRIGRDSYTNNYVFGISTQLRNNWNISPRISINVVNLKNVLYRTTSTYSITVSNKMFKGKLTNSAGLNYMISQFLKSPGLNLQSAYSITQSDMIKLNIRSSYYWGKGTTFQNFQEYRGSITYTHRF